MKVMIGAVLAAALIIAIVLLVRHFRGRPTSVVTPPPTAEQAAAAKEAAEILARMRTAYDSLETYKDTGLATEQMDTTGIHYTRGMFSTVFRKPHSLAFYLQPLEEDEEQKWHWIVTDGDRFESRASGAPAGHRSVSAALAGVAEESLGATSCVLPLLIHIADLERVDDLQEPVYAGVDRVEGHACFMIRGKRGDRGVALWIDQRHSLIRRVDFEDRIMIIITPEVGAAIPGDAFVKPPDEVSIPLPDE
jgi:hypothetical protein